MMMVGTDPTGTDPIVFSTDTRAAPNLINSAFIETQWTRRVECQGTSRLRIANRQSQAAMI